MDACLRIVLESQPRWWALENPIGRLRKLRPQLGRPWLVFDPCDYGDPWTKRTQVWGKFRIPMHRRVMVSHERGSSPIHRCPPGPQRQAFRSVTPPGFARAFFEANP